MTWFWLVTAVCLAGIELLTVSLTTLWFAVGAVSAMLLSLFGAPVGLQWLIFVLLSSLTLFLFRKKLAGYINKGVVPTNADRAIGQEGRVIETIDNRMETGLVLLSGQEWSARSTSETEVIEKGSLVTVRKISGVKLIVERAEHKA